MNSPIHQFIDVFTLLTQCFPLLIVFLLGLGFVKAIRWRRNHPRFAGAVIIGCLAGIFERLLSIGASLGMRISISTGFFHEHHEIIAAINSAAHLLAFVLNFIAIAALLYAAFCGRVKNPEIFR